jgi:NO-binding membrane sensor protein with MHYT domain
MILTGTYDPVLVTLSIAVAIMASYVALDLGGHVLGSKGWKRILWLAMAAVAMGGGIWSMHFIAMLAFVLPIPVEYDFKLTVISLLAAIIATGAGFYVVASNPQQRRRLALGGMLIGAGIVAMH